MRAKIGEVFRVFTAAETKREELVSQGEAASNGAYSEVLAVCTVLGKALENCGWEINVPHTGADSFIEKALIELRAEKAQPA